jgi:hypothetical protein
MSEVDDNLVPDTDDQPSFQPEMPPANFDFLIYSLRIQAEMHLGLLPFGEKRKPDFGIARHNIDLLAVLQDKTKGNLSLEEQRALDNSVTELRFRFVQAREEYAKRQTSAEAPVQEQSQSA